LCLREREAGQASHREQQRGSAQDGRHDAIALGGVEPALDPQVGQADADRPRQHLGCTHRPGTDLGSRLPADAADPGATLFPTLSRGGADADLTIVAYGGMLPIVEKVALELNDEEIEVRIIAPSLLSPLPRYTLLAALRESGRIAIVEETHLGAGFSSELAATLLENGYRGRLRRIATPPVPIPAARSLESQVIPSERDIIEALVPLFRD